MLINNHVDALQNMTRVEYDLVNSRQSNNTKLSVIQSEVKGLDLLTAPS